MAALMEHFQVPDLGRLTCGLLGIVEIVYMSRPLAD